MRDGERIGPRSARLIRWPHHLWSDSQLEIVTHTARAVPAEKRDLIGAHC